MSRGIRVFYGILVIALFFSVDRLAAAERTLRIHVLSRFPLIEVEISASNLRVEWMVPGEGRPKISQLPAGRVRLAAVGFRIRIVEPDWGETAKLSFVSSEGPLTVSDGREGWLRRFGGKLRVENRGGRLFFLEELPLEEYVRGVLASELPADFPLEAQKAQAVLIRSYALAKAPRHAEQGYDFCDLTHCQAYGGWEGASGLREEALRATRSLLLKYRGRPVEALFHSTCGGHTSANQKVFGGRALPYLQGVDDGEFCRNSPHQHWESAVPLARIAELLAADPRYDPYGEVRGLRIADREPEGRDFTLAVGGGRQEEIPVMDFLSAMGKGLGWNQLKSNWFELELRGDVAYFRGRGLGHGVGLCQWGARGMAEAGFKFDAILRHYFPGTQLRRTP